MKARVLDINEYEKWDVFLPTSEQYSIFAYSWYLRALGIAFDIIIAEKNSEIKGGIVISKDKWGYNINPVLGKYLGIIYAPFDGNDYTIETRKRGVQEVILQKLKALKSFEFTFHPNFSNWILFERAGFKQNTRYTYTLALENLNILENLNARLRNKIMKAKKFDFTIEPIQDFSKALPVLEQTYEKQGNALPLEKEKLQQLVSVLEAKNSIFVLGVYSSKKVLLAVLGLFYDEKTAYLILNGVNTENTPNGINEMLIYEGILWVKSKGLKTFDFEGSMIPSVESFYRQFGGTLTPYFKIWKEGKQKMVRDLKQKVVG